MVAQDFAQKAFARTPSEPFAGPIVGLDGVYVIALKDKIPSEIPALDKIRAKVEKDFQLNQAFGLARNAGMGFYQTLTNGLAQGSSVAALCAAAKLQLVDLPPFSLGAPGAATSRRTSSPESIQTTHIFYAAREGQPLSDDD